MQTLIPTILDIMPEHLIKWQFREGIVLQQIRLVIIGHHHHHILLCLLLEIPLSPLLRSSLFL